MPRSSVEDVVGAGAYFKQYGFNAIYLLPVNLYGPRDNFDLETSHVIPAMVRKCEEARIARRSEVELWGSGNATREFLYVDDAAEAIVLAAEKYDGPAPVNIGSGFAISVKELAALIADLTGFSGKFVWNLSKPDGQPRRLLNVDRAYSAFGFRAQTDIRTGLLRTIEWFRHHTG